MSRLGTERNPLRVAVVGSGPSGFYTAEALIRSPKAIHIDMFDRLPTPFGLVRSGVAPDHPKLKEATRVYEKIARAEEFCFLGNVAVGRDLTVDEIMETHHAVVLACGAESGRRLDIPGADLPGCYTATEFVGWYGGHPDCRDLNFDLSHPVAVIIGQGNVAADVCRILAKPVGDLARTDIAEHALDALSESAVEEIHLIGRRGPVQAKFSPSELRELGELRDCDMIVDPTELALNPESEAELDGRGGRHARKNLELFHEVAARGATGQARRCHLQFLKTPVALTGNDRLERVVLTRNQLRGKPYRQIAQATGERVYIDCGALFFSIGYRSTPIPGVPFDETLGRIPNEEGRVIGEHGVVLGLYCAGWIKRGPTGIIGTNRADSVGTVKTLLGDLESLDSTPRDGAEQLLPRLAERNVKVVPFDQWERIDAAEIRRGEAKGKPREKFTRIEDMLRMLQ